MTDFFLYLFMSFTLGAIFGSLLNVLVLRYGTGVSTVFRRSHCLSCGATLGTLELIPIFGFLYLRGRCRSCSSRISLQYPLVEILSGLAFVTVGYLATDGFALINTDSVSKFVFLASLAFVSIGIAVYDIRHKIIPNGFLGAFLLLSLIPVVTEFSTFNFQLSTLRTSLDAGLFLFLPFFLLWYFSEGRMMGLGDAMIAIGIGWLLGLSVGLSAIIVGVWLGALYGITGIILRFMSPYITRALSGLNLSSSNLTMKSEIPFAPFLLAGVAVAYFCAFNIFHFPIF